MKCALVTGASSGIGEALVHLLHQKGYRLILTGRQKERIPKLGEIIVADLGTQEGRQRVVEAMHQEKPDLVINSAGLGFYGEALSLPLEDHLEILDINCRVLLEITLEAAHMMLDEGKEGVILNVSSVAGEHPMPHMSVYAASKSFVTSFSRALNAELSSQGVHILTSCPGRIATNFQNRAAKRTYHIRGKHVMSAEYAARQIWWQIEKKKEKHLFNWRYRVASWVAQHIIPQKVLKRIIAKRTKTP